MKVWKNENNCVILEIEEFTYLISYKSVVAKVSNTIREEDNNYGLILTTAWDYSQTTLKQLYEFIELYTTQRDENGNLFAYQLGKEKNKKAYIQKQIDLGNIKEI